MEETKVEGVGVEVEVEAALVDDRNVEAGSTH